MPKFWYEKLILVYRVGTGLLLRYATGLLPRKRLHHTFIMYKNILWYRYNNLCFLTVLYPDVQNLWHLDRLYGKQINEEELRILLISRWVAELAQNKNLIKKNFEHARKNNVLNVFLLQVSYIL